MYSPREMRVSMSLKPLSSGDGGGGAFSLAALAPVLGQSPTPAVPMSRGSHGQVPTLVLWPGGTHTF